MFNHAKACHFEYMADLFFGNDTKVRSNIFPWHNPAVEMFDDVFPHLRLNKIRIGVLIRDEQDAVTFQHCLMLLKALDRPAYSGMDMGP